MHYHKTNLYNQIFSQVERAMYPLWIYNTKSLRNCYYSSIFCKDLWYLKMQWLHMQLALTTSSLIVDYDFPWQIFQQQPNFSKQPTFDVQIQCEFSLEWSIKLVVFDKTFS